MHDNNGIPLSAGTRENSKLILKSDYEDPATDYVTFNRELIDRSPIVKKNRIVQATNVLEEYRQAWTDTFKDAKHIVWEQLFRMLGATYVWEHTKVTQRLWNGRKAYRNISISLFGENIIFFRSERQKNQISVLKHQG